MKPCVLITGGAGGLARACRVAFKRAGYQVSAPTRVDLDVTKQEDVDGFLRAIPRLDVMIHAAGIARDFAVVSMSEIAFDEVLTVHLRGGFFLARQAFERMKQNGGHLIWIGSAAARFGTRGQANYAAAKAALCGLSASLAREGGPFGIQSNVVLPGFLETAMTAKLGENRRREALAEHVLGRFQNLDETAMFLVHLAGMRGVSGQVFQLDSRIGRWD